MKRKRLLSAAGCALVAVAIAGGVAYATIPGPGNVYSACMLKGLGTIRLIDKSLPATNLMSHCTDKETEISWNQAGQAGPAGPQGVKGDPGTPGTNGTNGTDGKDGVSVTTASEPTGANCAGGGVQLTAANGVSFICNGKEGTNGTNGADGADGVSVSSEVEPVGAKCTNGGSKFTAANGVTYACNGAPGSAGGPMGQNARTVYGADVVFVSSTSPPIPVAGLVQVVSVPADSVVYIATDGGLRVQDISATGSATKVFVTIDEQVASQGLSRAIICPNSGNLVGLCAWSLSAAVPLSEGTHLVRVKAAGMAIPQAPATAMVSEGEGSVNQGELTVLVLKKEARMYSATRSALAVGEAICSLEGKT
jgi:hypothetical protein